MVPEINFEKGQSFYNHNRMKHHIIHVFEHLEEKIVVYKFWSKRRQRWFFEAKPQWSLRISFAYGFQLISK